VWGKQSAAISFSQDPVDVASEEALRKLSPRSVSAQPACPGHNEIMFDF
jgi:hypothetical protein